MRVLVNGDPREAGQAEKLGRLLNRLGIDPGRVAVAVNSAVVPKADFDKVALVEGDRIEVIEAVGGG